MPQDHEHDRPQDADPPSVPTAEDFDAIVVGGGPAGLYAAERLATAGARVGVFDAMPTVGRKFLMAGRGGLNLTHSEALPAFRIRYGMRMPAMGPLVDAFGPDQLRAWADALGAETFVGSSGRIFPKALKASPLLRAWLRRLSELGVELHPRHRWIGWDPEGTPVFEDAGGLRRVTARTTLLALGGASWPRLGSDGGWVPLLANRGVPVQPFRPANMGFEAAWSPAFAERAAGEPLKNLELRFGDLRARGDLVVTRTGIEGGAAYALSAPLRDAIERDGSAILTLDLRPQLSEADLLARLSRPRGSASASTWLRKALGAGPLHPLLRELAPEHLGDPRRLAAAIKALPLRLVGVRPLERAISSAGGVAFEGVDDALMLRALPGTFVAGEMLDWEAPTGGYLLQGCFATAARAADGMLAWLGRTATGHGLAP